MSDELKTTLWGSTLPQSESTPECWQILYNELIFELVAIRQSCNCQHTASLLPECTNKVAAKKNSTLANLMSLDHSWSHTRTIIIICRTQEFRKLFAIFTKSSVLFFFQFPVVATSNLLHFRRESSLPLPLKKESQCGVGQCMVTFPEENFPSVFVPTL